MLNNQNSNSFIGTPDEITGVWDFVSTYYPDYSSCDYITKNDDLHKIIDGELNGQAEDDWNEAWKNEQEKNPDLDDNHIMEIVNEKFQNLKNASDATVYHDAIEGYIENCKTNSIFQVLNNGRPASDGENINPSALFSSIEDAEQYILGFLYNCGLQDQDFTIINLLTGNVVKTIKGNE